MQRADGPRRRVHPRAGPGVAGVATRGPSADATPLEQQDAMSRLRQPPRDRRSGDAAADDDDVGGSAAGSRGLVHRSVLRWMTSHHDATLYSTLTAGSRFSASSQTCHSETTGVGSRESGERTSDVPDRCKREGEVDEGDKGDELLRGRVEPTSGCQTLRNRRGGRALRVLKPLRCRGCGSPGVRRGGGSRLMLRELDGNGMGGGLRPDSVIQVCERQLGRWATSRSLPGPGVRPTPPLVSARHPPPVVPTPPWCPADTPRRKYSVRTHKEGGCTRTHERPCVVLRDRGRPQQPAGVGRRARRAGPAERRAGSI